MPMIQDDRWEGITRKARRVLERYGCEIDGDTVKIQSLPRDPVERQACKGWETVLWASYLARQRMGKRLLDRVSDEGDPNGERIGDWDMVKALTILSEVIGHLDALGAAQHGELRDLRGEILAWIREGGVRDNAERTGGRTYADPHHVRVSS